MPDTPDSSAVLEFSNSLQKKLGLNFDINNYDDLDINFIEAIFSFVAPEYGC